MEFGVFFNGYLPGPAAHDRSCEHDMLMTEARLAIVADAHQWKYAWFGEHHALTEYSHMSAPEVVMGYVAARTERIHLGSAIMSLSPRKEHPVRYAERAAMLDHITEGRYEFGTGRGAGSHEVMSFNITDTNSTKAEWDEVIREIPRMWAQHDYQFAGESFTVPTPHNVLPKPYGASHPPIWVACGNPPTFAKAGRLGIGAIAFTFEPVPSLGPHIAAYKEAAEACTEPLGEYQNNNVMMTAGAVCLTDRKRARAIALQAGRGYLPTMVALYHDTMPERPNSVRWPNPPFQIPDEATLDHLIANGYLLCGDPDDVCEQVARFEHIDIDQLVFGVPAEGLTDDEQLEMIEVFGDRVIPQFDHDPVHSTTHARIAAKPKWPPFASAVPDVSVGVLPSNARISLDAHP